MPDFMCSAHDLLCGFYLYMPDPYVCHRMILLIEVILILFITIIIITIIINIIIIIFIITSMITILKVIIISWLVSGAGILQVQSRT